MKRIKRECYIKNNICHIPLFNGQEAICDEDRFEEVNKYSWYNEGKNKEIGYIQAHSFEKGLRYFKKVRLHRLLYPELKRIDHCNGNKHDNRSCNLRECTQQQNNMNRGVFNKTGYKGIKWLKKLNKWQAQIILNRKEIYLGVYFDPKDAAEAYNKAALKYFGEFARLNIFDKKELNQEPKQMIVFKAN